MSDRPTAKERKLFDALRNPKYENFGLMQLPVKGKLAACIVQVVNDGDLEDPDPEDILPIAVLLTKKEQAAICREILSEDEDSDEDDEDDEDEEDSDEEDEDAKGGRFTG